MSVPANRPKGSISSNSVAISAGQQVSNGRRDSSLYSQKKSFAPIAPHVAARRQSGSSSQDSSFTNLNDLITDNIGSTFFNDVLGKI